VILLGVVADLGEEAAVETGSTVSPATESPAFPPAETSRPQQEEETAPAEAGEVDVNKLRVGDCFTEVQDVEKEIIFTVPVVPCSEPHSDEVFALVTLPDGDFPGQEAIYDQGEELCIAEFDAFVGLSYRESMLDLWVIAPVEEGWRAGTGRSSATSTTRKGK